MTAPTAGSSKLSSFGTESRQTWEPSRFHRVILFLMPLLVGLGPWASPTPGAAFAPTAFRVLLVISLLPATVGLREEFRNAPGAVHRGVWLTLGLILWGATTLLWSPAIANGLRVEVSLLIGFLLVLSLLGLSRGSDAGVSSLRWGFILALLGTGAIGMWEVITGSHLAETTGEGDAYVFSATAISATLGNPNNFGVFILGCTPAILALLAGRRNLFGLMALASIFAFAFFLALNTESRGAVYGLLAVLAVSAFALILFDIGYFIVAAFLGLVGAASAVAIFPARVATLIDPLIAKENAKSDELRRNLTRDALRYFEDSAFLGKGLEGFQPTLDTDPVRLASKTLPAHNTIAQVAAEQGIVGLLLFGGVLATCLTMVLSRRANQHQRRLQFEALTMLPALAAAMLVTSYFLNHTELWLWLGYLLCLRWNFARHASPTPPSGSPT